MCGWLALCDDVWSTALDVDGANLLLSGEDGGAALREATDRLTHRGPDGGKVALGNLGGPGRWALGHRRLAIVDPDNAAADQPFVFNLAGRRVRLAANGEIYNHASVYRKLVAEHGWTQPLSSASDCEVIAHAYAALGPERCAQALDGMFAFVLFEESPTPSSVSSAVAFAARDPVGIKPLYMGRTPGGSYAFASELKALVGHAAPETVAEIPPGHYWTPKTGLVQYHHPAWKEDGFAPWTEGREPSTHEIVAKLDAAVEKRMMADVDYGMFMSGGVDSCIVGSIFAPRWREQRQRMGDDRPLPMYTVGLENSPDIMASRAMVAALGGPRYVEHHERLFSAQEAIGLIERICFHMETYEAELIRSAVPNWLLAERAAQDVKMVLTGEGADELFAGYLYFADAPTPAAVQHELRRIYNKLGQINLLRTDRMTMAHGLEARVPFLDTEFTAAAMSVNPARKMVDAAAVAANRRGREKTYLRELFEGPNRNGNTIPEAVLWRAKAMQCEGVGENWVAVLQRAIADRVSDAALADAPRRFPFRTPQTKEEYYYRELFEDNYPGLAHVVSPWEGGCRAGGAAWDSSAYTREGLADVSLLTHAFQRPGGADVALGVTDLAVDPQVENFEGFLVLGGDHRSAVSPHSGVNKYGTSPQPLPASAVFRGSCTANPPTRKGYTAAQRLFDNVFAPLGVCAHDMSSPPSAAGAAAAPVPRANRQAVAEALGESFDETRARLHAALELPEGSEIILCASGTDAEYLPLVIARILAPRRTAERGVHNVMTQARETGAGCEQAGLGAFFSDATPLGGPLPPASLGGQLTGFGGGSVRGKTIPARNRVGDVVDPATAVAAAVAAATEVGAYPVVHAVYGGKTGLVDGEIPATVDSADGVVGGAQLAVVDACQGRFSNDVLGEWLLGHDAVVLVTGSKFYQGPPFAGCAIVPPRVAAAMREAQSSPALTAMFDHETGLGAFMTVQQFPASLRHLAVGLPSGAAEDGGNGAINVGLALRWEAALAEMESLARVSEVRRAAAVSGWLRDTVALFEAAGSAGSAGDLDVWCVHGSIISITIRGPEPGTGCYNVDNLRAIQHLLASDLSEHAETLAEGGAVTHPKDLQHMRDTLARECHLGQPVEVAEGVAVLRVALGASDVTRICDGYGDQVYAEDRALVDKIALVVSHFAAQQEQQQLLQGTAV